MCYNGTMEVLEAGMDPASFYSGLDPELRGLEIGDAAVYG